MVFIEDQENTKSILVALVQLEKVTQGAAKVEEVGNSSNHMAETGGPTPTMGAN
jgi:hypothetical protein